MSEILFTAGEPITLFDVGSVRWLTLHANPC